MNLSSPGAAGLRRCPGGETLTARSLHEPQPISNHPVGLGFHTVRGGIDPGDLCFRLRVVGVETSSFAGAAGLLTLARGATLAARWLHEPEPVSNQSVAGFPHPAGRYRPGGSAFSSPSCRDIEGFLIRRWELIIPGCGGTLALARGATLAARSLREPQPIGNHPVRLGFPNPAGRY